MPQFKTGNMWGEWGKPNTLFAITCNATVGKDGELVMGRGIAREMRGKVPEVPKKAGVIIKMRPDGDRYGLIVMTVGGHKVGLFQVKDHFKDAASVGLIRNAAVKLAVWCQTNVGVTVNLNFPGIGYGRLERGQVEPLLTCLPDSVHIWSFGR